MLAKN